jgi:hypothetical protein
MPCRSDGAQLHRLRRDGPALRQLGAQLHQWVRARLDQLEAAIPELPVEDRASRCQTSASGRWSIADESRPS